MKVTAKDFEWSERKIIDAMKTYARWPEFVATTCGKCKITVNLIHGAGWFCTCGEYNLLPTHYHTIPHDNPDLGPAKSTIMSAVLQFEKEAH